MKKIVAGVMSACITLGSTVTPVFATTSVKMSVSESETVNEESVNLEKAILAVKKKVEVPTELTEFTYRLYNGSSSYDRYWNLTWADEEGNKRITVRCDDNGHILSYSKYDSNEERLAPTYTKDELIEVAENFIKQIAPELKDNIVLRESVFNGIYNGTYNYIFERIENGIRMPDDTVNVSVNYVSKEVKNFNANWTYDVEVPDSTVAVTIEEAREKIGENIDMELKYLRKYEKDGEDEVIKAYLVYAPNKSYVAIDAKTGEIYETHDEYHDMEEYGNNKLMNSAGVTMDAMEESSLTEQEIEKIEEIKGLISKEDAIKAVTSKKEILLLDDNAKAVTANLSKNYSYYKNSEDGEYVWNISFSDPRNVTSKDIDTYRAYISATVDAKTGKLLSYNSSVRSYYDNKNKEWEDIKVKYNETECRNTLEELIKELEPEKFSQTKISDKSSNGYILKYIENKPVYGGYSYSYIRMNEGLEYTYNGIYGKADGVTGKIYSYRYNWDENVEFESPKNAMSKEEAYKAYSNKEGFELVYEVNNNHYIENNPKAEDYYDYEDLYKLRKEVRLVYRTNINPSNISPFTGEQLDYNGETYEEPAKKEYIDLEGFWGERSIQLITDMGYTVEGREFKPNEAITGEELNKLMQVIGFYMEEQEYKDIESITKLDAIKMMIKKLGLEKLAQIDEMYKTPFSDTNSDIGYVALAKGLNIVSGDEEGRLNGDKELSRIEAVCMALKLANLRNM